MRERSEDFLMGKQIWDPYVLARNLRWFPNPALISFSGEGAAGALVYNF